jgi:hypothetical protein
MDALVYLFDVLKYCISGLIIFFVAWFIVREYLQNTYKFRLIDLKKSSQAQTLPLRLQAYERVAIYIERINPANMLIRLHVSGVTVRELQHLALSDIRTEYQHNMSQQLYISHDAWAMVKDLKEKTINLLNNAAKGLPPEASSVELSKTVLTHLATLEENPYDIALDAIRKEMQYLF